MTTSDPYWPRASDWLARSDEDPRLVVVGVPTSAGSISPSEAWETPAAFRRVLARFPTFDGESGVDLDPLTVADRGDWPVAHLDAATAVERIRHAASGARNRVRCTSSSAATT